MCTTAIEEMNLIHDVLSGDRKAEQIFYEKYKQIVYQYIKYKYQNNNEIDDDVSEIMIKCFSNLKLFDCGKAKLKTWVVNITKNYMIDKWRINKLEFVSGYDSVNCSNNEQSNFDAVNLVNHLSNNIDPNDYVLLNMKYYDGYKLCEIGNEFNISTSKVLNKISRIKSKVKEKYLNQI